MCSSWGTRWWAGRDNITLPESTPSHANCLKTRRLPPVGCIIPVHFRDAVLGAVDYEDTLAILSFPGFCLRLSRHSSIHGSVDTLLLYNESLLRGLPMVPRSQI